METVLERSELPGMRLLHRGKVRDVYAWHEDLLIVATDRVSSFDYVLSPGIPGKGRLLTEISTRWMRMLDVPNHLIDDILPDELTRFSAQLAGRSVIAKRAEVVPVECVVRGYLTGSGWKEYTNAGTLGFEPMPQGLREAERLARPRFTPTTKAAAGHDQPLSRIQLHDLVGVELAEMLEKKSLELYAEGAAYAETRGLLVADTKFEWGFVDGALILVDEVLTPDSSRFWDRDHWQPGSSPQPLDKQVVRNYLLQSNWDRSSTPPPLPPEVVQQTSAVYRELKRRLFG